MAELERWLANSVTLAVGVASLWEWCFSGVGRAQFVHSLKDTLSADT